MAPRLQIEITWNLRKSWHAQPLLRRVAAHVAHAEGFRTGHLSVVVLGRRAMTTVHNRFLGLAEPTDVLSFDLGTNRRRALLDAEIILCGDVALQRTRGRPRAAARAELALYLAHGLLHLAGYDDHSAADSRRMHAREDQLLSQLKLRPVFARPR